MDDLATYKRTLTRGSSFALEVRRGEDEVTLRGDLPAPGQYYVFKRDVPSGAARVSWSGNRIEVESSRVGAFSILVHPDMARLDDNLVITWNGRVVSDARVEPSIELLLRNFLGHRDRSLLHVARLYVGPAGTR